MPSTFERPMSAPPAGLTLKAVGLKVCPSHLNVTLMDGSEITLHLTNCFARSVESLDEEIDSNELLDEALSAAYFSNQSLPDSEEEIEVDETELVYSGDRWSLDEQRIIEAAVAAAISRHGCYYVTLPIPHRSSGWWDALNEKTAPFAGFLWLDDSTTLQQLLVQNGTRRETPSGPTPLLEPLFPELPAPRSRPVCGLSAPCKILAGVRQADSWWIQFDPGFEVLVRLIDCYTPPIADGDGDKIEAGTQAYVRAANYLYWPQAKLSCTIPMLEGAPGWWNGLTTRSEQPAFLWITDQHSLNNILVRQQLASSEPPTAVGTHDRRCA